MVCWPPTAEDESTSLTARGRGTGKGIIHGVWFRGFGVWDASCGQAVGVTTDDDGLKLWFVSCRVDYLFFFFFGLGWV